MQYILFISLKNIVKNNLLIKFFDKNKKNTHFLKN